MRRNTEAMFNRTCRFEPGPSLPAMVGRGAARRMFIAAVTGTCLAVCSACSIAGSWKRVATDPPGAPFPLDYVAFDRDNRYTATWHRDDDTRTSTGRYDWNGFRLEIMHPHAEPRIYKGRLRLDGHLVLTYEEGGAAVTATLARTDE